MNGASFAARAHGGDLDQLAAPAPTRRRSAGAGAAWEGGEQRADRHHRPADPQPQDQRLDEHADRRLRRPGDGAALEREVDVVRRARAHARRADVDALAEVLRRRRAVHAVAVDEHVGGHDARPVVDRLADLLQLERVPTPRTLLADLEGERGRARVAVRGDERDGDEDHADVHDHPAVGPSDQATPALAARRQDELAARRSGGATGEPERDERRPAARTEGNGDDERAGAAPRRPEQPLAQQLGARLAPRQHRGDGHQEQQGQPDRRGEPVEVRRADDRAPVLQRLDEQREDGAEQDDEGEHREQHVVGEERALARQRRVDRARRAQAIAAPRDQGQRDADDEAEEHQQVGADRAHRRRRGRWPARRSG